MSDYIHLDKTERPTVAQNQFIDFDGESKEHDSIFDVTVPYDSSTPSEGLIAAQNSSYGWNSAGSYDDTESVDDSGNTESCTNDFDKYNSDTASDILSYEKDEGNNHGEEETNREETPERGSLWNKLSQCGTVALGVTGVLASLFGNYDGPDDVGIDVARRSATSTLGPVGPTPTPDIAMATQIQAPTGQMQVAQEMAIQAANNMAKSAANMSNVAAGAPGSSGASGAASSSSNATLAVAAVAAAAYATMPSDAVHVCNVDPEIYPGKVFLRLGNLNQTLTTIQRQAIATKFDEVYNEVIGGCDDTYERFGVDIDLIEEYFGSLDNGIPYVNIILEGKVRCHGCVPSKPFFGEHEENLLNKTKNLLNTTSDSTGLKTVEIFSILGSMLDEVFPGIDADVQLLEAGEVHNGETVGFKFSELTLAPSNTPTMGPTSLPSQTPTTMPSAVPSTMPSVDPSTVPSNPPSKYPSEKPTFVPSSPPSDKPSLKPSLEPSKVPSQSPTLMSSGFPSKNPSSLPSVSTSSVPSLPPSAFPSNEPSALPSFQPSYSPSVHPTAQPSVTPSMPPSAFPSHEPSTLPSFQPSYSPSAHPTAQPSVTPSESPSILPSNNPSIPPFEVPSASPSFRPSISPSYSTFVKRPSHNVNDLFDSNPKIEEGVLANPKKISGSKRKPVT